MEVGSQNQQVTEIEPVGTTISNSKATSIPIYQKNCLESIININENEKQNKSQ